MRKSILHEERINALRGQFGPQADMLFASMGIPVNPKEFATNAVIQDALIEQVARHVGLHIGSDYIAEKLSNPLFVRQELAELIPLAAFNQMGVLDARALHYFFKRAGISMDDFEQKVGDVLLKRATLAMLGLGSYVPYAVVRNQYALDNSLKKFSVLTFPFERVLQEEKKSAITESDLKAFFDARNEQSRAYYVPEKRSGIAWKLKAEDYNVSISDHEIEDYYENNKNALYIQEPAQIQVRHILIKVASKEDQQKAYDRAVKIRQDIMNDPKQFALIASRESDDKSQVEKGGLLPWFKRGEKEVAFDKASFTLKENGDVSGVVATNQGFEIIQRVDKKAAIYKPLASIKKEIASKLSLQKFSEQFVRDMRGVIENSKTFESGLQKTMEERGLKPEKIQDVVREDKTWGKVIFGMTSIKDADAYIDNGVGVVVQLTGINKAYLPSLDAIKDVVTYDLHEKRASQKIEILVQKALEAAKTQDLDAIKGDFNATISTIPFTAKSDTHSLAELSKKGLPIDRAFQIENKGGVVSAFNGHDGYIVKLDEVKALDQDSFEKQKHEIKKSLEQDQNRLFTAGFVASLYRSATIEFNQSMNETMYPVAYED
jgi:parvulin-like peptidyl-prolyl isomerase